MRIPPAYHEGRWSLGCHQGPLLGGPQTPRGRCAGAPLFHTAAEQTKSFLRIKNTKDAECKSSYHRIASNHLNLLPSGRRPQHRRAADGGGDRGSAEVAAAYRSHHALLPTHAKRRRAPRAQHAGTCSFHMNSGTPPIAASPRGGGFETQRADLLSGASILARPVTLTTARRQGRGGAGAAQVEAAGGEGGPATRGSGPAALVVNG